jgi:hypothetical protein
VWKFVFGQGGRLLGIGRIHYLRVSRSCRSSESDLDPVFILCCTRNGISRHPKTDLTSAEMDHGLGIGRKDSTINFGSLTDDRSACQYVILPLFDYRASTNSSSLILALVPMMIRSLRCTLTSHPFMRRRSMNPLC